ncbi:MAG: CocE/NonD family hydrolase [Gemmatimonadales bacterium]
MKGIGWGVTALALAVPAAAQQPAGPYPRPTPKFVVSLERNVAVPMRDGVVLRADIYRPVNGPDRLPVVLMRTPYNKAAFQDAGTPRPLGPPAFFAGQGYVVVVQDIRGQYESNGFFQVQNDDGRDGFDTIDWIVKRPWSTGKVGTYGCSYLGEVQMLLAKMRHPNHAAMIPQSASGATGPAGGFYTNWGAYEGGAFTLSTVFGWFRRAGHQVKNGPVPEIDFAATLKTLPLATMAERAGYAPSEFRRFVSSAPADSFWAAKGYLTDQDRFDVPALHVNSWLDVTPEQTMYLVGLLQRNSVSAKARDNQFVIMSPTTHCASEAATTDTKVGDRSVGDARLDYYRIYLDWFDHWLKGVDNGALKRPKIEYYVMGKNAWRTAPSWPVPGSTPVRYHLSSRTSAATVRGDGQLTTAIPTKTGKDTFEYDPERPFPSRGGTICCTGNPADQPGIFDQSDLESRADLLVYSTPPLERVVTIAGTVKAVLYVSSDAKDTDFTAKLLDVSPDGRSWNIVNGILRARYREGIARKVWMAKDKIYRVEVSLKATAYQFPVGHRIRLHVSSSDFPAYDRNLNTGGNNYDETTWVKATNAVHFGPRQPSHLLLPVVPN